VTLLVKPISACNLGCEYCYENSQRTVGNFTGRNDYDLGAIEARIAQQFARTGQAPVLHGGEITMMPKRDLFRLLDYCHTLCGRTALQTNGLHIDAEHLAVFRRLETTISVSIDGPGALNHARWAGSDAATTRATARIQNNFEQLLDAGIPVGLIVIITRLHLVDGAIAQLQSWLDALVARGLSGGRFNLVEADFPELKEKYELTAMEAATFYQTMADWALQHPTTHWGPFCEIAENLMGLHPNNCIYVPCNIYRTAGVVEILGTGELGNCAKIAHDGIPHLRDEGSPSHGRAQVLSTTPHAYGGCKGCKYWSVCHGQCPSEAIDRDWRNKSRYCEAWYALYEHIAMGLRKASPEIQLWTEGGQPRVPERGIPWSTRAFSVQPMMQDARPLWGMDLFN